MPWPEAGPVSTVDRLLAEARHQGLDRLDAGLLLGHRLARPRAWLIAHGDAPVDADTAAAFRADCARRAAGVPVAYLLGEREFHGLRLRVTPDVLVPRPDTETLVDWALELLAGPLADVARPRVIDLGTGSGAIALAVRAACPRAEVWAVDRSDAALAVARANAAALGLALNWRQGDWWRALENDTDVPRFDLVLSNPPYIAPDDPHLADLAHEPSLALVAADDGLADLARIVAGAPAHLVEGGWLLLEHGWQQADAVGRLLAAAGFGAPASRRDLGGQWRCTGARHPPQSSRKQQPTPLPVAS